jgi:hypothetical protein
MSYFLKAFLITAIGMMLSLSSHGKIPDKKVDTGVAVKQEKNRRGGVDRNRPPRTDRRPINRIGHDSRRNNVDRSSRMHTRYGHRPAWNRRNHTYRHYAHVPYRHYQGHTRRFTHPRYYHYTIPYRFIYWNRWIRFRVTYGDGYVWHNGYPYFVYNGYMHRYSHYDLCSYDLVDGYTNDVVTTYGTYSCAQAYDICAERRDDMNWFEDGYRYFCSERFDYDSSYNYGWDNDDYYSDLDPYYY